MDQPLQALETHRTRLFGLAYRMLGSRAEAEDLLQDAYLRLRNVDMATLASVEAWLVTTVSRLAIDRLRRAKTERAAYFGPWLPEPLAQQDFATPEMAAELGDDISIAFLTLLEALAPEERAAFVLHDVLDDDYADIAEALGKTQAACRQLVHRARERVLAKRRRFQVDEPTRKRMLEKFIEAANKGDRRELVSLFATDAVMLSDGGGKVTAVHRPLHGAERIARLWWLVATRSGGIASRKLVRVNGELAIGTYFHDRLYSVATIETDGQHIHGYFSVANPDKLAAYIAAG